MLEVLVRGNVEGGGLLWVLLVQLLSLAHGCRLMEGFEVLSSWEQVSQRLWTTWGNIDYLFSYVRQCVSYSFFILLIVKRTFILVAGGEEESLFSVGGRWQWCYWVVWLGGIYGSMVWGEF